MKTKTRNQLFPTCGVLSTCARLTRRFSISNSSIRLLIPTALLFFAVQAFAAWDDWHTGYATPTTTGYSGGAALLDPISSDMEITALNYTDYNYNGVDAGLAGAYLQVYGPNGNSTVVYVTDTYPEGPAGALDLCFTSFSKIGELSAGQFDVRWRVVKGSVNGNFSYRIKDGTNPSWAAIQVRNHKYPVMKMEYYQNGGWNNMVKQGYNHFVGENLGSDPIQVRITDIRGVSVTDTVRGLPANGTYATNAYIVQGNVQFPDDQGTTPATTGTYKLIARHSGKALEAGGNSTANGTQIQQWDYVGSASQQWAITDTGNGNYKIIGVQSGKAVDIDYSQGGTANGTKVQLWDYWNGASQQFKFTATDSGYYRISPNCAPGSCLDLYYATTTNGAAVKLYQWTGGANQQWLLQPVNGTAKLIAQNSGKSLCPYGGGTANGTQIHQWSYLNSSYTDQQWTLTDTGSGNYKFINVKSGKALDISGGNSGNDTKVQLYDSNGATAQRYKLTSTEVGQFRITPNCATGSCLDVSGPSTADGAKVHLWQWLNAANQKWSVQKP